MSRYRIIFLSFIERREEKRGEERREEKGREGKGREERRREGWGDSEKHNIWVGGKTKEMIPYYLYNLR
jgi:hypothetical protein